MKMLGAMGRPLSSFGESCFCFWHMLDGLCESGQVKKRREIGLVEAPG